MSFLTVINLPFYTSARAIFSILWGIGTSTTLNEMLRGSFSKVLVDIDILSDLLG